MKHAHRNILAILFAAAASLAPVPTFAGPKYQALRFDQLLGWDKDDHSAALAAFLDSCEDISAPEWAPICSYAATQPNARVFFESLFTPVLVRPAAKALFTGYFEPELNGSIYRVGPYKYPVYRKPDNLTPADPALSRKEIENGALKYKGLEIAYVDDPVALHYLHIQGSGRINLTNGNIVRVGYAGENGHVFRSAAAELIRLGEISPDQASIEGITKWVSENPERGLTALQHNASYVFFREVDNLSLDSGPLGALERPLTALRSIAVDPKFNQLGAPVWVEKGGRFKIQRLMIAQDVGAAIKGPQRADIFFGTGTLAGKLAGQVKDPGRMVVLLPNAIAYRLVPEG